MGWENYLENDVAHLRAKIIETEKRVIHSHWTGVIVGAVLGGGLTALICAVLAAV